MVLMSDNYDHRLAELEARVARLEQRQGVAVEAASSMALPVLRLTEPAAEPRCDRCETHHSPELPCPTPVDEAWARHGKEPLCPEDSQS